MSEPVAALPSESPWLRFWAMCGAGLCMFCVLALAFLQYGLPAEFVSGYGLSYNCVPHFQEHLFGRTWPPLDPAVFHWCFWLLLAGSWAGYVVAMIAGMRGGTLPARPVLLAAALAAGVLAVGCPPTLSPDVYAYVAYGRMLGIYGHNPCQEPPTVLNGLGDPLAELVIAPVPSPYGPVWTFASVPLAWLVPGSPWLAVVAMKLLAGAGLIGTAVAGKAITEQLAPGRGNLTLLGIALNPLFLIEGPGIGHNDLVMMALLLGAGHFFLGRRWVLGSVLLGCAVGIKYIPAAALPWICLDQCRARQWAGWWWLAPAIAALTLAPTLLGNLPFHVGSSLGGSLRTVTTMKGEDSDPYRVVPGAGWIQQADLPEGVASILLLLLGQWPVLVAYAGLSLWLYLDPTPGRWLEAWGILALMLFLWTVRVWFPWYLIWPFSVGLISWTRPSLYLCTTCIVLSVLLSYRYSYVWW